MHGPLFSGINAPQMRNELVGLAKKPLRALRSGRFWLSPVVAQVSPRHGAMMKAYRLEEEGRFDEALAAWRSLAATRHSSAASLRFKLRQARLAMQAGEFAQSVQEFEALLQDNPDDARVQRGLESAALRGARHAQSKGHWLNACRMWAAFGRVSADIEKCVKNLGECARYVAQTADSVQKMKDALEAWSLLKSVDPHSREAQQGMEWCHLSLARAAERASEPAAAREHWETLLELSPGDQRALDGLKRLDVADA